MSVDGDGTGGTARPGPVAEYGAEVVAQNVAVAVIPKRQPWGGPDWPQRSGYEIRAEAERQTARVIRDVLRVDRPESAESE
jgi:hypothetical protein